VETDLAGGGEPRWRRLSPGIRTVWRLGAVSAVVVAGLLAVPGAALAGGWAALAAVVAFAGLLGAAWVVPGRRYDAWAYAERESDLLLRRGVLVRRLTVVPYGRMQFVDVAQGPLDRLLGLSRVVLHTAAAATDASIPGLEAGEAIRLRDRLAELGGARGAGV
jgi:membrane protein YdbS with pleckstrin-like domain